MALLGIEEAGTCYPLLNDFFSFIFLSVRVCAGHIPLNFLYHLFIFLSGTFHFLTSNLFDNSQEIPFMCLLLGCWIIYNIGRQLKLFTNQFTLKTKINVACPMYWHLRCDRFLEDSVNNAVALIVSLMSDLE